MAAEMWWLTVLSLMCRWRAISLSVMMADKRRHSSCRSVGNAVIGTAHPAPAGSFYAGGHGHGSHEFKHELLLGHRESDDAA